MTGCVQDIALAVLLEARPMEKVRKVERMARLWDSEGVIGPRPNSLPSIPARPERPKLVDPNQVPRRRLGSDAGRAAMLHAIAHIELNAIDLACDMIARFASDPLIPEDDRQSFVADWISVAGDEARHFEMLQNRLTELGFGYGDFPAHNGLWEAAVETSHHIAARLAIAPMVLEARGLDVTPGIINKLTNIKDAQSVAILETIYREEVNHVAIGVRWFKAISIGMNRKPQKLFKELVNLHFKGKLKPPFNHMARTLAGMPEAFYA